MLENNMFPIQKSLTNSTLPYVSQEFLCKLVKNERDRSIYPIIYEYLKNTNTFKDLY